MHVNRNLQLLSLIHILDDFQEYQDNVEVQRTDLGNRDARLTMIKERTSQQLTTFNELLTNNEDVNLSDIILNLSLIHI